MSVRGRDGHPARRRFRGAVLLLLWAWALAPGTATAGRHGADRPASEREPAGESTSGPIELSFQMRPLRLTLMEPWAGQFLAPGPLVVRGVIEGAGPDTSVTVSGEPALVRGQAFVAVVEAVPGATKITAVATTLAGARATATVPLRLTAPPAPFGIPPPVRLSPGVAPLEVSFTVPAAAAFEFDRGRARLDLVVPDANPLPFVLTQPGIHTGTTALSDHTGRVVRARAIILVLDREALDAVLKARWAAMRDALRAGDVARAASYIAVQARAAYTEAFTAIAGVGAGVDRIFPDLTFQEMKEGVAVYRAIRTDAGGRRQAFEVRFVIDGDGVWRIQAF